MEEGEGEGLVEDDEGVARLPERVEKGYLPGCDGERVRGHAGRGRRMEAREAESGLRESEKTRSARVAHCNHTPSAGTCTSTRAERVLSRRASRWGISQQANANLDLLYHPPTRPRPFHIHRCRPWIGSTTTTSPTHGTRYVPVVALPIPDPHIAHRGSFSPVSRPGQWPWASRTRDAHAKLEIGHGSLALAV